MRKILFALVVGITLVSCGTKHKVINNEKVKTEIENSGKTDSTAVKIEDVKIETVKDKDSTSSKVTNEITVKDDEIVEVEGDGSGEITVEETKSDDGTRTIRTTGAKNLTLRRENSLQVTQIEELTKLVESQSEVIESHKEEMTELRKEYEEKLKQERKKRDVDVQTSGITFMGWVWIILIVIILIAIWYLQKRFGWIGKARKMFNSS